MDAQTGVTFNTMITVRTLGNRHHSMQLHVHCQKERPISSDGLG